MNKYRSTWHLNEFTLVHTVRYLDPKNGKRFAAPYKTKEKAKTKMDQLKKDGVKDIEITQDTLRGNIKFKEGVFNEDTDQEKLATLRTRQMMLQTKVRDMDQGDPKTKTPMAIAKNDIENIEMKMDQIKDKIKRQAQNEMLEIIGESIKSDDDYRAKKKALQDIQNNPKTYGVVGKDRFMKRKEKLDKDYADFKSKNQIAASMMDKIYEGVHPAIELLEAIAAVKNKAKKTGMPYSILKQVYNRGMAAWKGGHRPGTTPQQWAMARVNSFVTKSSGTWGGADKDLAKKVRARK